jgi:hypothetical protein
MAFVGLTTAETDADSPLDTTLMTKIKDNLDDLDARFADGSVTSAKLVFLAGATLINTNATARQTPTNQTTPYKLKETLIDRGGVISVGFDLKTQTFSELVYGRIYKNGVAQGTQRSTTITSWTTFSEDLVYAIGDNIQVYGWCDTAGMLCHIQNLTLSVAQEGALITPNPSY